MQLGVCMPAGSQVLLLKVGSSLVYWERSCSELGVLSAASWQLTCDAQVGQDTIPTYESACAVSTSRRAETSKQVS